MHIMYQERHFYGVFSPLFAVTYTSFMSKKTYTDEFHSYIIGAK